MSGTRWQAGSVGRMLGVEWVLLGSCFAFHRKETVARGAGCQGGAWGDSSEVTASVGNRVGGRGRVFLLCCHISQREDQLWDRLSLPWLTWLLCGICMGPCGCCRGSLQDGGQGPRGGLPFPTCQLREFCLGENS